MKLTILRGLPASGKSTYASELVAAGAVRVNRDLLREMMNFSRFKHEDMVVDTEKFVVRGFLGKGIDVVVDDCNLNPANIDMWREVARLYAAEFDVISIETPVAECIARDKGRVKEVGYQVINNMALEYGLVNIDKPVVVCDIDGTIADIEHRRHFVTGDKKDWAGFFGAMDGDTVRADVREMLEKDIMVGRQIIFVSARPEDYREITTEFLKSCGLPTDYLLMRRSGDKRPDTMVKEQLYNRFLKNLNVENVYDDRPSVIRMWRQLGLSVTDVGNGIEF